VQHAVDRRVAFARRRAVIEGGPDVQELEARFGRPVPDAEFVRVHDMQDGRQDALAKMIDAGERRVETVLNRFRGVVQPQKRRAQRVHVFTYLRPLPVQASPVPVVPEEQEALEIAGRQAWQGFRGKDRLVAGQDFVARVGHLLGRRMLAGRGPNLLQLGNGLFEHWLSPCRAPWRTR
jgi:hypothetical protein